jgi:glyoxylase-like metal-dependent hydrolase (beta-lactamase superfamily II)
MQVTENIHALEIPFTVPVSPERALNRVVFAYLVFDDEITLIDSGVSGSHSLIFEYIKQQGREPHEISKLILSHSHPDHIGSAKEVTETSGCRVYAHPAEKNWIEDTGLQARERPIPGFNRLVSGSIIVDHLLEDGNIVQLGEGIQCQVIHTPGHSAGSISLFLEKEKVLLSGDALPVAGDLPIYDDITSCLQSVNKLKAIPGVEMLLSSWEPLIRGQEQIQQRIGAGVSYLQRIHQTVLKASLDVDEKDTLELCKRVMAELGLPPFAANPIVAKAFASSLSAERNLFERKTKR